MKFGSTVMRFLDLPAHNGQSRWALAGGNLWKVVTHMLKAIAVPTKVGVDCVKDMLLPRAIFALALTSNSLSNKLGSAFFARRESAEDGMACGASNRSPFLGAQCSYSVAP